MDWQILLFALVATIITTLVGLVWFSRLLFGDIWLQETLQGRQRAPSDTAKAISVTANAILEFMTAMIFKTFLVYAGLNTASEIFGLGFLLFIGFMLPILLSELVWVGKGPRLFAINAGYRLTTLAILCILGSILL